MLINMHFLINTYHRSKSVLLSFPLQLDNKKNQYNYTNNINKLNRNDMFSNEILTEVFLVEGKQKHILDLTVGNFRYIGFPYDLDNKQYFTAKMVISNEDEEEVYKNTTEKKKKIIKLKSFTILLVYYSHLIDYSKIDQIYNSIEAFSKHIYIYIYYSYLPFNNISATYLAIEEYRTIFLGHEIMNVLSNINQNEDLESGSESSYLNKQNRLKQLYESNMLIKNLKQYFEDMKNWPNIQRIFINNILEFKFPLRIINIENPYIEKFHSLIIFKRKNIQQIIQQQQDLNQIFLFLLENSNSLKSLFDLSLEFNLDLNYLNYLANQIEYWGLGKVIKKVNNYSILYTNPDFKFIQNKIEKKFEDKFGISIYFATQNFLNKMSIFMQFKKNFSFLPPNKFLNMVNFLLENQCIVQCNVYYLLRSKFKGLINDSLKKVVNSSSTQVINSNIPTNVDDDPEIMLMNKSQIAFKKNDKYHDIINEFDNYSNLLNKFKVDDKSFMKQLLHKKKLSKYEKKMKLIKDKFPGFIQQMTSSEIDILNNIRFFLTGDFSLDEVVYYSGYKEDVINSFFAKYDYLFNIIVIQDY